MLPTWTQRAWGELANILIVIFLVLPIAAMVLGSIQTEQDLFINPTKLLPDKVTFENYIALMTGGEIAGLDLTWDFKPAFINSLIVGLGTTFLTVTIGALSAYTIARLKVRGSRQLMYAVLATRMVPVVVLIIPLYIMLRAYGLLNTLHGIIIGQTGLLLPYAIWMLISFFQSLPSELEDAARVDGCTRFGAFWRIIVPLSTPGIAACGVIIFLMSWTELLLPLILGSTAEVMTLPVLISTMVSERGLSYSALNAAGLIAMIPTVVLVLILQRFIVKGLTGGAVKG